MIHIKRLNRDLRVIPHESVDFTLVVTTLAKRILNLSNGGYTKAEHDRLGKDTERRSLSIKLILVMCSGYGRKTRQCHDDEDQCIT